MPFKDIRKTREYSRLYMRKLRATKKGLTIKSDKLNPVKPKSVKPEPCQKCQALETIKKAYENLCQQLEVSQEQKREY